MKKILFILISFLICVVCFACTSNNSTEKLCSKHPIITIAPTVIPTKNTANNINNNKTSTHMPEVCDKDFVKVKDYITDIKVNLKYATEDNFTGQVIYNYTEAYLRYGTVKKLKKAQEKLHEQGYNIVIWDAYRTAEAQYKLWEVYPDANYVSNPNKGFSKHSRGNTVDISLESIDGKKVEMPTDFDNFTKKADRDYSDVSNNAGQNALLLENTMINCGFTAYSKEWWHFSDIIEYEVQKELNM